MGIRLVRKLSIIAEYRDESLECEFFNDYMDKSRGFLQALVLMSGLAITLFAAYDFFYYSGDIDTFLLSLSIRLLTLEISVIMFFLIRLLGDGKLLSRCLIIYEAVTVLSCFLILFILGDKSFIKQSMAAMLLIAIIFIIPNRWVHQAVFSLTVPIMFLIGAGFFINELDLFTIVESATYLFLGAVFFAIPSYQSNCSRRDQYLKERQLEMISITDKLTQAFNRQKFDAVLSQWVSLSREGGMVFSLIMFDLDNYKSFNDTYGHLAGDRALVSCAEIVRRGIRENDLFARWGGEEFMILLPMAALPQAGDLAERLRLNIESHVFDNGYRITASFSVVQFIEGDDENSLLARLDSLLYKSKAAGKNMVVTS